MTAGDSMKGIGDIRPGWGPPAVTVPVVIVLLENGGGRGAPLVPPPLVPVVAPLPVCGNSELWNTFGAD